MVAVLIGSGIRLPETFVFLFKTILKRCLPPGPLLPTFLKILKTCSYIIAWGMEQKVNKNAGNIASTFQQIKNADYETADFDEA